MVEQPLLFSGCSSIQFSNLFLVTYRIASEVFTLISYNFYDLGDTMLHYAIILISHPTYPRKAENFPWGIKYSNHVPVLT